MSGLFIFGSCLSLPFAADIRGTLSTISTREGIVEKSILSILSTRQGERVMLPDYGVADYTFQTIDAGFPARLAYILRRQILTYEPLVGGVNIALEADVANLDAGIVALNITYVITGQNTPHTLVFPIWQFGKPG